ncbi:MAG: hypothetical protein B7Y39_10075 [Bdellovibrio sp. 28-41-41]|nr:MAG: hypothetical protein B7Y39_10075 [Bdellovibrio sp. 28-41-41]
MTVGINTSELIANLKIRDHLLVAGVSEKLGGHDEGPNPHEILEAALAACTILTAKMYATRKGYKVKALHAEVNILSEGKDSKISREVKIEGDLTPDERARILEIMEKCPIHKLLESNITIETKLI